MKLSIRQFILAASLAWGGCSAVTHTPPGTSVETALAKKPEVVKMAAASPTPAPGKGAAPATGDNLPAVEPPMPEKDALREKVGEAYSRGVFLLGTEQDQEAMKAFEEAVKLDPTFTEAWEHLAALYEKTGDTKKALEAFKKAKKLARQ